MRNFFKKQNSLANAKFCMPRKSFVKNKLRNSFLVRVFAQHAYLPTGKLLCSARQPVQCFSKTAPATNFAIIIFIILIFTLLPIANVSAAINKQINYQGKLTTSAGVAVANGTYNMEFILYDDPTLGGAHILWTETRTTTDKVQVTSGLFSVLLGEVTALTGVDFNQTLYLGVNIGGTGTPGWDGEMTPRKKLGAVPAAVVSENAINMIGGVAGAVPYQSAASTTLFSAAGTTGQTLISGGTGSPTWFAPTAGSVLFAGTSGILQQDNANLFWDDSTDRLGIGTTAPGSKLTVFGNSQQIELVASDGSSAMTMLTDSSGDGQLRIKDSGGTTKIFLYGEAGADSYINNSGNVGIGTTNPGAKLEVTVNSSSLIDSLLLTNTNETANRGIGTALEFKSSPTGQDLTLKTGKIVSQYDGNSYETARLTLQSVLASGVYDDTLSIKNSLVGIGTTAPSRKLTVVNNSVSSAVSQLAISNLDASNGGGAIIDYELDDAWYPTSLIATRDGAGYSTFNIQTYSTSDSLKASRLYVNTAGNVGIGTTSPTELLSLGNGAARKFWIENTATDV
ncbi:MAG: hypothetical protein UR70_C0023G0001, partial [Candidatus Nomurabacteria bacterium GW2011_GWB1_35_20]